MLLEEIERIEEQQQQKEEELEQWRVNFENDMEGEQSRLQEMIDTLSTERSELENQLNSTIGNFEEKEQAFVERIHFLNQAKQALESKNSEVIREITSMKTNLNSQKKVTTADETKWESEKTELFEQIARANEIMEEKEQLKEDQLDSLEDGYKTSLTVLDQRIKMLNEEKRLTEKTSQTEVASIEVKLGSANKDLQDMRDINIHLHTVIEKRETVVADEVEAMRIELSGAQIKFDNRERAYIEETRDFSDKLIGLHELLRKAQDRLEVGWDPEREVSEVLRDQVTTLERQLDVKDAQNEKMKGQVIKAQNSERVEITDTCQEFRSYLKHMN